MPKYVVNAAVDDFARDEVVEIDPALFQDLIAAKFLSPIDDWGNRLTDGGEMLVLSSTTEEQRRAREAWQGASAPEPEVAVEDASTE